MLTFKKHNFKLNLIGCVWQPWKGSSCSGTGQTGSFRRALLVVVDTIVSHKGRNQRHDADAHVENQRRTLASPSGQTLSLPPGTFRFVSSPGELTHYFRGVENLNLKMLGFSMELQHVRRVEKYRRQIDGREKTVPRIGRWLERGPNLARTESCPPSLRQTRRTGTR